MRALLMSSSCVGEQDFFAHAARQIHALFNHKPVTALLIPYASVSIDYDEYARFISAIMENYGCKTRSIHEYADPVAAVKNASAIIVGGGNTFVLLKRLYDAGIVDVIADRVKNHNVPYLSWSAGTNVACPTIKTTNDMPIAEPKSLKALNLVPFQINVQFYLGNLGNNGSREYKIEEFLAYNENEGVIALKEGAALLIEGKSASFLGDTVGYHYSKNKVEVIKKGQMFSISNG